MVDRPQPQRRWDPPRRRNSRCGFPLLVLRTTRERSDDSLECRPRHGGRGWRRRGVPLGGRPDRRDRCGLELRGGRRLRRDVRDGRDGPSRWGRSGLTRSRRPGRTSPSLAGGRRLDLVAHRSGICQRRLPPRSGASIHPLPRDPRTATGRPFRGARRPRTDRGGEPFRSNLAAPCPSMRCRFRQGGTGARAASVHAELSSSAVIPGPRSGARNP